MSKRVYIDLKPLLNCPAFWKEAFTDRGDGKTSAIVKTAIESRLSSGLTPTICRRWGSEMGKQFKDDILTKIKKFCPEVYEQCNLVWQGNLKQGGLFLVDKNEPAARPYIHAFPLSMVTKMKSGLDVSTHRNLYIDEYIPLDGRYLPNEAEVILELYRTIDRDYLLTTEPYLNYVLICGNRVGRAPATDLYFNVDHDYNTNTLKLYKDNSIAVFTYANKGHTEYVKTSKLASLVRGTPYADYAEGGALRPTAPQIWAKKLPPANFIIKGANTHTLLCFDTLSGALILSAIYTPLSYPLSIIRLTIDPTDNSGYVWVKRIDKLCERIRNAFTLGRVMYTDTHTAELCVDITTYLSRL